MIKIDPPLQQFLEDICAKSGTPYFVGGTVRDFVMGRDGNDIDIEIHGMTPSDLIDVASRFGEVKLVGESFGVFKLRLPSGFEVDMSLPRKETKRGSGHRGFDVEVDPFLSLEKAASRRDFTINAMMMNPFTFEVHDFFGGQRDIEAKFLRATSDAFKEDPLRVLRGVQFAARFGMWFTYDTAEMAKSLASEFSSLAIERVWGEFEKFFQKAEFPERGLTALLDSGWIQFFPELLALKGVKQDPYWHPEGDVWRHTGLVMKQMVRITRKYDIAGDERTIAMAAALTHDFGKPETTIFRNGHWRAPGHDMAGVAPATAFLNRIGAPDKIVAPVAKLVAEHMAHSSSVVTPRTVRRLSERLHPETTIQMWEHVVEADASGRAPAPRARPAREWLYLARAVDCDKGKPKPIIGGDTLIARGLRPGPSFKPVLDTAYNAQLDGSLNADNADKWLSEFLSTATV